MCMSLCHTLVDIFFANISVLLYHRFGLLHCFKSCLQCSSHVRIIDTKPMHIVTLKDDVVIDVVVLLWILHIYNHVNVFAKV